MSNVTVDLFQTFPNLQVSSSDLLQAETFISQTLQSQSQYLNQPLDLRPGTALYDLVIRPTAVLYSMLRQSLMYTTAQNTLSNVTDSSDSTIVDALLSNWFATRNLGTYAVISARLYFAISKNVTVPSTTSFSPDGQNFYLPTSTLIIPSSSLIFDPSSGEYYFDVTLQAQSPGTAANLNGGGLIYFTNFDPYFLRATINYLAQSATDPETNTQFISRVSAGISTRNLINTNSIAYNVLTNFPSISQVESYGMGDTQMIRDQVQVYAPGVATPIWIHSGGYADIYISETTSTNLAQYTLGPTGSLTLTGPIMTVSRSAISGGTAADTVPSGAMFTLTNPNVYSMGVSSLTVSGTAATATVPNHGISVNRWVLISGATPSGFNGWVQVQTTTQNTFTYTVAAGLAAPTGTVTVTTTVPSQDVNFSTLQTWNLSFGSTYAGGTVSLNVQTFDNSPNVQAYLDNSANRVICANYLARAYNQYHLVINVNSYANLAPSSTTVLQVAQTYVASLPPGAPFIVADFMSQLGTAGLTNLQTPPGITYTLYAADVAPATLTGTITDVLEPPDLNYVFLVDSATTGIANVN
jgi:hypothetical protein